MEIKDIELMPTEQLMGVLFSRFDTVVFMGQMSNNMVNESKVLFCPKGNVYTVLGLAHTTVKRATEIAEEGEE